MLITITRELIDSGRTARGGWTVTQINLLGLQWPPAKKWKDKVIGTQIEERDAVLFLQIGQRTRVAGSQGAHMP